MLSKLLGLFAAGAFLFGVTAYAHHSYSATYNTKKEVKLEGKLVQFQFRNPHSFIQIEAKDEKGNLQRWTLEWGGSSQLGRQSVTRTTFKVGDEIIVGGHASRVPGERRVLILSLARPSDGFTWSGVVD